MTCPGLLLLNTSNQFRVFVCVSFFLCNLISKLLCFLSWLPEHVTLLAQFVGEVSPVKSTVTKAVAEFRRTHADTWNIQKDSFTEEQLEVVSFN